MNNPQSVCELVRTCEEKYQEDTTISKYVTFNLAENINKIEAYANSKHISGSTDALGREKPFFNIGRSAENIWFRATDIDRKDIVIKATKSSDTLAALLATFHLQNFMNRSDFGTFLNDWGRTLSRYGSAVVEFVEKAGELHATVLQWNKLIIDPIDFDNGPVIKILEYTPAQLRKQENYDQDKVEELIDAQSTRKTLEGLEKDNRPDFIRVYEVHGEMPLSYLTKNEKDDKTYVQQMHVVSFVKSDKNDEYDEYTLVKGRSKKMHMITHLLKEDGRSQSIGAYENIFDPQWMQNHSVKMIKDQLDMASKLIYQTSDGSFAGMNAINAIENGDILVHQPNQPLVQFNNTSHDIVQIQNFATMWKQLGNEVNGISDAMMGAAPKAGTAWRQTEALLQENHSLFELMTENKILALEQMLRQFIIPFIKTKMDTADEISATLDAMNLEKIDRMYVPFEVSKRLAKKVIGDIISTGEIPTVSEEDKLGVQDQVKSELESQGDTRFFKPSEVEDKTWKEAFKDIEWELDVVGGSEQKDTQAAMDTLKTALQVIVSKQGMPFTPEEKLVIGKILNLTGQLSPMELASIGNSTQAQPPMMPPMQAPTQPMS